MFSKDDMNEAVARLRREGLPESRGDLTALDEESKEIVEEAYDAAVALAECVDTYGEGDERNQTAFRDARQIFREAVAHGLLDVPFIQDNAPIVGAIPDPKDGFRYYREYDGYYRCWTCDAEVQVKTRYMSIHDGPVPGSGFGEVQRWQQPYCPCCEPEPPRHGSIETSWPGDPIVF